MKYQSVTSKIREVLQRKTGHSSYLNLEHTIRKIVAEEAIEKDPNDQISAGTYKTKHFDYSPAAQQFFTNLPKNTDPNKI